MSERPQYKFRSPPFSWLSNIMEAQQREPGKKLWKGLQKGSGGALEGWGPFGYNQEAAQDVRVYPEEDSGLCQEEPHLAGLEDAGGGVPAEPGAAHASNAPGGDCQGWWHDEILI